MKDCASCIHAQVRTDGSLRCDRVMRSGLSTASPGSHPYDRSPAFLVVDPSFGCALHEAEPEDGVGEEPAADDFAAGYEDE